MTNSSTATLSELDTIQRRLIADKLGVSADQVTLDFLDDVLETRIYPRTRLNVCSRYGGYRNVHLRVLTGEEIARVREQAEVRLGSQTTPENHAK